MKKGITLVETMVVTALFGLLFGIIFSILSSGATFWEAGSPQQDVQAAARLGMELLSKDLYNTSTSHIHMGADNPSDSIMFKVPIDQTETGNVIWGTVYPTSSGGTAVTDGDAEFLLNGNELRKEYYCGSLTGHEVLIWNASALSFYLDGSVLEISLTASTTVRGKVYSSTATSKVAFRN